MRNAYAKFMLRLIRPALELRDSRTAAMAKRLGQATGETLRMVHFPKTEAVADQLMQAAGYRPDGSRLPRGDEGPESSPADCSR